MHHEACTMHHGHAPCNLSHEPCTTSVAPCSVPHTPCPCPMHHAPCIMCHAPCAMHHEPCNHAPWAMRPVPRALHHAPCAIGHAQRAMRHAPCTMHNAGVTLRPRPQGAPCAVRRCACNVSAQPAVYAVCHVLPEALLFAASCLSRSRRSPSPLLLLLLLSDWIFRPCPPHTRMLLTTRGSTRRDLTQDGVDTKHWGRRQRRRRRNCHGRAIATAAAADANLVGCCQDLLRTRAHAVWRIGVVERGGVGVCAVPRAYCRRRAT
mmetsp:Transcript_15603/g.46001  ORF Transcript_15603/g.46001 Transcript_15603/m.46001 type:complete len:263 (-) Transcript_15603:3181-3969(-)